MLPDLQIFLARNPSQEYLVNYVQHNYQIWREERVTALPQWKPENIRFPHDPNWRKRFMSVQCVCDSMTYGPTSLAGVFWAYGVRGLFLLSIVSYGYMRFSIAIH